MKEEKIWYNVGDVEIEGLYQGNGARHGVAITHPHPLYGGDMFNPVVEAIVTAYHQKGFATLRFNFRGTGGSTGHHEQGIGERTDVVGAVKYLKSRDCQRFHLSGYSFGSWVNAMALQDGLTVQEMTMVAPPVAFIDFADDIRLPPLTAVVAGGRDAYAPPDQIRPLMDRWNPDARLEIIHDADHFFFGYLDGVTQRLAEHIG